MRPGAREQVPASTTAVHPVAVLSLLLLSGLQEYVQPWANVPYYPGEPCQLVQNAEQIYVGQVISIRSPSVGQRPPSLTHVGFAVVERFRNIGKMGEATDLIVTDSRGVSIRQRYLIYVSFSDAPEHVATTLRLEDAEAYLSYLRQLPSGRGHLGGFVEDSDLTNTAFLSWAPAWIYSVAQVLLPITLERTLLHGVSVCLEMKDQPPRCTLSDGQGRFHFEDLRPGAYKISIDEQGVALLPADSKLRVVPGSCPSLYLKPIATPAVIGRVTWASGHFAIGARI